MATHPVMMTNGLPNPALMGNGHFQQQQTLPLQKPSTMHHHQPQAHPQAAPPWSGGSAGSSGPPSFSSHLPPLTSLGSPNDVGLMSTSSAGPQQPPKPVLSPGPPPPPPAPPAPPSNTEFQSSYSGTELVMLYDYKVNALKTKKMFHFKIGSNFVLKNWRLDGAFQKLKFRSIY